MSLEASFRSFGTEAAVPVVRVLRRTRVTPNELTVLGSLMCALSGLFLMSGHFWVGGGLLLFGGMCDWLDGQLARATGQVSRYGAFLDAVLDRLSDLAPLLGILTFAVIERMLMLAIMTSCAVLVSAMIPYAKAQAATLGVKTTTGVLSRAPRFALLVIGVFGRQGMLVVTMGLIGILGTVTVVQRMHEVYRKLEASPPAGN